MTETKSGTAAWIGFLVIVGLILSAVWLEVHPSLTTVQAKEAYAYGLAGLFGASVGTAELVSRYRDKPTAALSTHPALVYLLVNALASLVAFWLLYSNRLVLGVKIFGPEHPALNCLLLGGFGAMALFRTAVFNIKLGDATVSVGPAAVLQVILRVTDRETDRRRAGPRAARVGGIMRGVVYERARDALPLHCFALMQNLTLEEQSSLEQSLAVLDRKQTMGDEAKAYSLGLLLMNLVGEDVLQRAVEGLGERIKGPPPDLPAVLSSAAALDPADLVAVLATCRALAGMAPSETDTDAALIGAVAEVNLGSDQVVIALAKLRRRFGPETVAEAVKALVGARLRQSPTALNLDELKGNQPPREQPVAEADNLAPKPSIEPDVADLAEPLPMQPEPAGRDPDAPVDSPSGPQDGQDHHE